MNKFSDHQPCFTILKSIQDKYHIPKYVKVNRRNGQSLLNFKNEISHLFTNHQMINDPTQDPNINYNILHSVIQQAKEKHIPTKCVIEIQVI